MEPQTEVLWVYASSCLLDGAACSFSPLGLSSSVSHMSGTIFAAVRSSVLQPVWTRASSPSFCPEMPRVIVAKRLSCNPAAGDVRGSRAAFWCLAPRQDEVITALYIVEPLDDWLICIDDFVRGPH